MSTLSPPKRSGRVTRTRRRPFTALLDASFTRGCESRCAAVHESTVSNEIQRSVPSPDGSPGPAWVAAQITRRVASEFRGDASASLQRREKRRCADSAPGTRVTRRRLYCLSMATPLGGREPSFGAGDCERLEAAELWWTQLGADESTPRHVYRFLLVADRKITFRLRPPPRPLTLVGA